MVEYSGHSQFFKFLLSIMMYFNAYNLFYIIISSFMVSLSISFSYKLCLQHDSFFSQHNLSMRNFVISVSRSVVVDYISSPEVNFLRSIQARFRRCSTKLILQFLGQDDIEPSINQTYSSLLKNLTFIKTFASGILIPKNYVWPVDHSQYLQPHTSVVLDAHEEGLEVFASGFANDATFAYNYSYDPVAEYISFIDNGNFSVDGVLSDFPNTPSASIGKLNPATFYLNTLEIQFLFCFK